MACAVRAHGGRNSPSDTPFEVAVSWAGLVTIPEIRTLPRVQRVRVAPTPVSHEPAGQAAACAFGLVALAGPVVLNRAPPAFGGGTAQIAYAVTDHGPR